MKLFKKLALIIFLFNFFSFPCVAQWIEGDIVVLQALDKITARIKTLEFNIGEKNSFGILDIKINRCLFSKPTETPESIAFMKIIDISNQKLKLKKSNIIFEGWMFASSPALNSMEHPVYDLTLITCKKFKTSLNKSSLD